MTTATELRRDSAPQLSRVRVLVVDVREQRASPIALAPADDLALERAQQLPAGTGADLAVLVHDARDAERASQLARWSRTTGVPALTVAVAPGTVLAGPLTMPDRPGCGHCAAARMRAAGGDRPPAAAGADEHDALVARAAAEVRATAADALDRSRLLDHVIRITAAGATRHRVIPLACCAVCGGAAALARPRERAWRDDPADAAAGPLAGWVDALTGVVPALKLDQPAPGTAAAPVVVTAAPPRVVDEHGALRTLPAGWGKGATAADAIRSAVGEAIERYSASLPDPARIVWSPAGELEGDSLEPAALALYAPEQYDDPDFPYARYDPALPHPWVRGRWLDGGGEVWVPAVLAHLALTIEPHQHVCQGTSNGLAASTDGDDAALRATLELVERDAFLTSWMTAAPTRRVGLDESLEPDLRAVLDAIAATGSTIDLRLLATAVHGTVALCVAHGDGRRAPGAAIGLGADLDPRRAVRQAILELGQTHPYLSRLLTERRLVPAAEPSAVREMLDHAAYYFPAERARAFEQRLRRDDRPAIPLRTLRAAAGERSAAACGRTLAERGIDVAIVDVTAPDVATGPFHVVRAISPQLQALTYGHGRERLPVPRVHAAARAAGAPPIHPIW